MGWLKELMKSSHPPIRGYGELARASLQQSSWPTDTQPKARSLAALFSKLDRGIELEWLVDRPGVQLALSQALGCPLNTVREQLDPLREKAEASARVVRWDDVPFARSWDLLEEPLPPGLPRILQSPSAWHFHCWQAESGSGRSLAGRWLSARGYAHFVQARTAQQAAALLPSRGAAFVELERLATEPDLKLLREQAMRSDVRLLLACPSAPGGEHWQRVAPVDAEQTLSELLSWLAQRLPEDGAFDARSAEQWLLPHIRSGHLRSWGAVLGAAGWLDRVGMARAQGRSLWQVAVDWVAERLSNAQSSPRKESNGSVQWLRQRGFEVLVQVAQQALVHSDLPFGAARDEDEWMQLVPQELRQSVDAEWVTWTLGQSGGLKTAEALREELSKVPPGSYRIIFGLREAGLLRPRTEEAGLRLCPEFLKDVALREATRQLLESGSPFAWGEALLRRQGQWLIDEELRAQLAQGRTHPVEQVLDFDAGAQLPLTAALEVSFLHAGLHLCTGGELPDELLQGLWEEQLPLLIHAAGQLPEPRVLSRRPSAEQPVCHDTRAFWLAALAIGELLDQSVEPYDSVLRPWDEPQPAARVSELLDAIESLVTSPRAAEEGWALGAYALVDRLQQACPGLPLHPLGRPYAFARSLRDQHPSLRLLRAIRFRPIEVKALQAAAEHFGLGWSELVRAAWYSWAKADASDSALLSPDACHSPLIWAHLPLDLVPIAINHFSEQLDQWPLASLNREHWTALGGIVERSLRSALESGGSLSPLLPLLQDMPEDILESVLTQVYARELPVPAAAAGPAPALTESVELAWRQLPRWCGQQLGQCLSAARPDLLQPLLALVPRERTLYVIERLGRELASRSVRAHSVHLVRDWLRERIASRAPNFREAYPLLVELERRIARGRAAEGQ